MKKANKKENNTATVFWIFKRTKKYLPLVVIISIISALDALTFIALAILSKDVLDIAMGTNNKSFLTATLWLFAVIAAQLIMLVTHRYLQDYTQSKLVISMRKYLFSSISKKKFSYITNYHSGDLLNRITSDSDVVIGTVVGIIPNITSMIAKIIGGISALLILDARLALVILVLGFSVPALGRMINKKYKSMHKEVQKTEGKVRAFIQECFENIVVIKSFASETPFTNKLTHLMRDNFKIKMKRVGISVGVNMSLYSFFTIGYYTILVWGAGQISKGAITYGTLTAFLQLVSQLRAPLQNVSGILPQYYSALASAERLIEIENGENDIPSLPDNKLSKIKKNFSGIQVNNVTFAYKDETILESCNFEAKKGHITAITGESGSGKSTIFKVILGLFEAQEGNITINNDTVLDTSLRGLFAYVPQGNMILSGSIRDNITLCNDNITEEEVIKATKAAEIYDTIISLPDGFDTVVTERGGGLSEGQIQRISLARALLTDAPVLLLDEATSALDEPTETRVLSNIKELNDKTILFVTHRNTSLKVCDKIIRVEDKKFITIKE